MLKKRENILSQKIKEKNLDLDHQKLLDDYEIFLKNSKEKINL